MSNHKKSLTKSGHEAGLQSSQLFKENENALKRKRDAELGTVNSRSAAGETVYRDKSGKKLDMVDEFMKRRSVEENTKAKLEQAQYEWGKGSVQKQEIEDYKREMEEIANEPFARTIDDPKLERIRKEELRLGDPMAAYFSSRKMKNDEITTGASTKRRSGKPLYNGPLPLPNRFGIRPGYRWDAIDRGNGFEKKLMIKLSDKNSFKEDEYKWSVADL